MKQLYYVNGKRVDFDTYANALDFEIATEEAKNIHEIKVKGFIEYIKKNPSVLETCNNSSFSTESIIKMLFYDWCKSDECQKLLDNYQRQKKMKAWGCLTLIIIFIIFFVLRVSGVI